MHAPSVKKRMYPSDKYIHVQRNLVWDVACCGDAPSPLTEQMVSGVLSKEFSLSWQVTEYEKNKNFGVVFPYR